jgi:hypothetical protein
MYDDANVALTRPERANHNLRLGPVCSVDLVTIHLPKPWKTPDRHGFEVTPKAMSQPLQLISIFRGGTPKQHQAS